MAEQLPTYSREDLDKMSRVQLRQTAVNFGKKHREATNMESEDIKEFVLGKQEGGGGEKKGRKAKDKGNGKPAAAAKGRGRKPKAAPEPEPEPEQDEAPSGDLADLIHKLGLGMDDGLKEVMEAVEALQEQNLELKAEVVEVQHSQFLINGLVADILKNTWEPKEVDERVNDLEEIWQQQQDGGDDEGNE
jgi:hypothetical protein